MRTTLLPVATVATQTDACSDGSCLDLLSALSMAWDFSESNDAFSYDEDTRSLLSTSSQTVDQRPLVVSFNRKSTSHFLSDDDDGYDVIADDSDDSGDIFDDSFGRPEPPYVNCWASNINNNNNNNDSNKRVELRPPRGATVIYVAKDSFKPPLPPVPPTLSDILRQLHLPPSPRAPITAVQSKPPTGQTGSDVVEPNENRKCVAAGRSVPRMGTRLAPRPRPAPLTSSRDVMAAGRSTPPAMASLSDSERSTSGLTVTSQREWNSDGDAPRPSADVTSSSPASDSAAGSSSEPSPVSTRSRDAFDAEEVEEQLKRRLVEIKSRRPTQSGEVDDCLTKLEATTNDVEQRRRQPTFETASTANVLLRGGGGNVPSAVICGLEAALTARRSGATARRLAYEQFADIMYTNRANLAHTIAVQQKLFQQQLAAATTTTGTTTAADHVTSPPTVPQHSVSSSAISSQQPPASDNDPTSALRDYLNSIVPSAVPEVTSSSERRMSGGRKQQHKHLDGKGHRGENQGYGHRVSEERIEWVVKKRPDGTRYITRRKSPTRRRCDVIIPASGTTEATTTGDVITARRKEVKQTCVLDALKQLKQSGAGNQLISLTATGNKISHEVSSAARTGTVQPHPILAVVTI